MRLALLVAFGISVSRLAVAAPAHDVVSTLERGMRTVANHRDTMITALHTSKGAVLLRPGKAIVVARGITQTGFFLGPEGKLSQEDRSRLNNLLSGDRGATRQAVVRTLRTSLAEERADEKRLAGAEPRVKQLLAKVSSANDGQELYRGKSGSLSMRQGSAGPFLLLQEGFHARAIFLQGNSKEGYSLDEEGHQTVARMLLDPTVSR